MTASTLTWPAEVIPVSDVCNWISSVFPTHPAVTEPTAIYTASTWGIAARFTVATHPTPTEVILKVCPLALYQSAPHVYELLMHMQSPHVPRLLAWTKHDTQSWMLFRPFIGRSVWSTQQASHFVEMARILALLQVHAAPSLATARHMPTTMVEQLPGMFDAIVADMTTSYASMWEANERAMALRYSLPSNPVSTINSFRTQVQAWSDELAAGEWPLSLDHVDCHANNAAIEADDLLILYDWDEAICSCPFFSLDRLLDSARSLDEKAQTQHGVSGKESHFTQTEQHVWQIYVDSIPWKSREQRARAIDVAISLAPIKTCYECTLFAQATGWPHMPMVAAWHMGRALRRWNVLLK